MKEFKLIAIQMCCSYSYAIKVNMNKHVASVHEGKKPFDCMPFRCETCEYSCFPKSIMKIHVSLIYTLVEL